MFSSSALLGGGTALVRHAKTILNNNIYLTTTFYLLCLFDEVIV